MLRSVKSLEGFAIGATDGDISVGAPGWNAAVLPASITQEQIKNSPSIDTDRPVSRQYERDYLGYYGYPYYWGGAGLWGANYYPVEAWSGRDEEDYDGYLGNLRSPSSEDNSDPHLRSCNAVKGYHIQAKDGEIGHVQGFLIDDSTWSIRYLIVNTSNWWMGHQVLLSPEWIEDVSWRESIVTIDLDRETIKAAPAYDPDASLEREAEGTIYGHYGRQRYWDTPRDRAVA